MNNGKQPITPTMYTKCGDGEDDYQPLKDGQKTGWEVKFGGRFGLGFTRVSNFK